MLIATDLPKDSQFPVLEPEWPEAARYASLSATRDTGRIQNIKIFWIMMHANVRQWINALPWLYDRIYESMKHIAEFKEDMHRIYIRARKDPTQAWTSLCFIAIDDIIDGVVDT